RSGNLRVDRVSRSGRRVISRLDGHRTADVRAAAVAYVCAGGFHAAVRIPHHGHCPRRSAEGVQSKRNSILMSARLTRSV
ncbi:unnamed protein product, partial [Sphacelaria rigidula]